MPNCTSTDKRTTMNEMRICGGWNKERMMTEAKFLQLGRTFSLAIPLAFA